MQATDIFAEIAAEKSKPAPSRRERKDLAGRRLELRDQLWPDAASQIWSHKDGHKGYATLPRLVPLVAVLAKELAKLDRMGDPTTVYLDLWSRVFDEGFVQIKDESDCAYASGYMGARAERTWRERMRVLEDLGLIRIMAKGNSEFANVLLINPMLAAVRLKLKRRKLPEQWWGAFMARADEIGAEIPTDEEAKEPRKSAK